MLNLLKVLVDYLSYLQLQTCSLTLLTLLTSLVCPDYHKVDVTGPGREQHYYFHEQFGRERPGAGIAHMKT